METAPRLSLIVAMARNRAIGVDNHLPWHLPADLKHFRALTMGHPIIMGRKTFDSIGRVLPGRRNIVVTRNRDYRPDGVEIVHSVEEALEKCRDENEAFVIGGAHLYQDAIHRVSRIYVTEVHAEVKGDVFFSEIDLIYFAGDSVPGLNADVDIYYYEEGKFPPGEGPDGGSP